MKNRPIPQQIELDGSTRQQMLYDHAITLLRQLEPPKGYYLSTSFGKDSIAAHRLCDEAGVRYDAHHNITGIDPPELVYFGRKHYPGVLRHRPSMSMWKLIERKGILPLRQRRFCCEVLKEDGGMGRVCVMGIRAEESSRRRDAWAPVATRGDKGNEVRIFDNDDIQTSLQRCMVRDKLVVNPIYHWTSSDLWAFIKDRKMPYCNLYDEGFERLGCIGCPMTREKKRRRELERWPGFYQLYMRAIQKLIDKGRFQDKGSAQDVMDWWLSDKEQLPPIDGQVSLGD